MTRSRNDTPPDLNDCYFALGLSPGATRAAIKAAFRKRAKELHPDRNASASAREDFQRIVEAYQKLSGIRQPSPPPKNHAPRPSSCSTPTPRPPIPCYRCGRIAAQPRHVEFPMVRSRPWKIREDIIRGIYCRRCADLTALQVSLTCWIEGWWFLPSGPGRTLKALIANLRGGIIPSPANFTLLIGQAKAFLLRGEHDLARGTATQAMEFSRSEGERQTALTLISRCPGHSTRILKNRWQRSSFLRLAQIVPFLALIGLSIGAYITLSFLRQTDDIPALSPPTAITPPATLPSLPLRSGHLYEVTAPHLVIRAGPDDSSRSLATLKAGDLVLVTENIPDSTWVRIAMADGSTGFVPGQFLSPGIAEKALGR